MSSLVLDSFERNLSVRLDSFVTFHYVINRVGKFNRKKCTVHRVYLAYLLFFLCRASFMVAFKVVVINYIIEIINYKKLIKYL